MIKNYLELKAPIFNIQTYSIHDGPGIRVTVFEKGCPLRCKWCANPESNIPTPQLMVYTNKCTACGRCTTVCPCQAIKISQKSNKPCTITDRTLCINCGRCVDICPCEAREIVGEEQSVADVLEKVQRDRMFIDASGGGMTISGGECLVHPDFTEALLYAAKEAGLHTAIESCSFAAEKVIDQVYKYVDLALLDIKHMDSDTHIELTGVPNNVILNNIKHIYHDLKKQVIIRMPTIPGYNDSHENIVATARFISDELGKDVPIHLLPYHRLGESKNDSLGRKMNLSIEIPSDEHMQELKKIVERCGVRCQIGG